MACRLQLDVFSHPQKFSCFDSLLLSLISCISEKKKKIKYSELFGSGMYPEIVWDAGLWLISSLAW